MREYKIYDNKINIELTYLIGSSAQENWDLIDIASQKDVWFHLSQLSSPHVILIIPINVKMSDISKQTLLHCGLACKNNSKYKNLKNVKIIYTEIKNIKKGDNIGQVTTKKTNYFYI